MLRLVYVGNESDPNDRTKIVVSVRDRERIQLLPRDGNKVIRVKDHLTDKFVKVRRADCGAGCKCALEFVKEGGAR